jgi:hydroxymethylbilane synthase
VIGARSGVAVLRLATRGSALARAQAALAAAELDARGGWGTSLVVVSTGGDRNASTPIAAMEGQGWFTADVERAVLEGRADIAVHSAKDLPTTLAAGLAVVAVLRRGDPRDAVVTAGGGGLAALPEGAVVGTSSARRAALIGALYPRLSCRPIRGNVDTRLRRLDAGEVDALVLAAAGLDRLGLGSRIDERLDPHVFVPAPAQGAIALEAAPDSPAARAAAAATDTETAQAVGCERAVLLGLGGGCLLALGAYARLEDGMMVVTAALAVDGAVRRVEVGGDPARLDSLIDRVVAALR